MKFILLLKFILIIFLFAGCSDFYDLLRLHRNPLNERLSDCSNIQNLKVSLFDCFESDHKNFNEKYKRNINNFFWIISETDTTFEVRFGDDNEIRLRENLQAMEGWNIYVLISKKNCQVIDYWKY